MGRLFVTLVRHAKSSWEDPTLADHDRPLNRRGRLAAADMAGRALREGWSPDLLLTSTAVRACETAAFFQRAFDLPDRRVQTMAGLYNASPETLLKCIRAIPPDADDVLVFAHNPGLEDLAATLAGRPVHFPTCAVARFACAAEAWARVKPSELKLLHHDFPKNPSLED